MSVQIYRYGEARSSSGLWVGITRHLPRGVRRSAYATKGYFNVWLPLLSPSRELLAAFQKGQIPFSHFARRYRAEMKGPATRQTIRLLAATARSQPVHLGCFCADATQCHRSLLRELVDAAAAELPPRPAEPGEFSSPACAMPEIED